MTTIILFIRHGQTDWNVAGRWQGHIDVPLNELGEQQARLLAHRIAGWPIKAIYSSDLRRAAKTATILGMTLSLQPFLNAAFRERNGGIFQGLTAEEIQARHKNDWLRFHREGVAPPGGETNLDLARRVMEAYKLIVARHQNEMVAIVSHGGALNVLISHILGFPLGQSAPISLRANTGLSIVEIDDNRPRLTLMNDICHLSTGRNDIEAGFSMLTPPETK